MIKGIYRRKGLFLILFLFFGGGGITVPKGKCIMARETWKYIAGSGSGTIPSSTTNRKWREKTGSGTTLWILKGCPQWHTQQGHITSQNTVTNWGSNIQALESMGNTIIQTSTGGEDKITPINIIHFIFIFFLYSVPSPRSYDGLGIMACSKH